MEERVREGKGFSGRGNGMQEFPFGRGYVKMGN